MRFSTEITDAAVWSDSRPASASAETFETKRMYPRELLSVYDILMHVRTGYDALPMLAELSSCARPFGFTQARLAEGGFHHMHQATEGSCCACGKRSSKATGTCLQTSIARMTVVASSSALTAT